MELQIAAATGGNSRSYLRRAPEHGVLHHRRVEAARPELADVEVALVEVHAGNIWTKRIERGMRLIGGKYARHLITRSPIEDMTVVGEEGAKM